MSGIRGEPNAGVHPARRVCTLPGPGWVRPSGSWSWSLHRPRDLGGVTHVGLLGKNGKNEDDDEELRPVSQGGILG